VSSKSGKIAELIQNCTSQGWDPHFLGYFECFNSGLYFEAHDVLEELWLKDRSGPNYYFYKGLIQLAGAFVHLQKHRLKPAVALFDLATTNLSRYPVQHEGIDLNAVLGLAADWRAAVTGLEFQVNPLKHRPKPHLTGPVGVPDKPSN
jgi:predicted metal-dependent hydrolase